MATLKTSAKTEPTPTKILLVDDNPNNLVTLKAVLERPELHLLLANSGRECLKILEEHEVAVVIMDVQMPVLDGFETAALIRGRHQTRNLPIIFLTAERTEENHITRGFTLGAVDYITKPVQAQVLQAKIQKLVDLFIKGRKLQVQLESLYGHDDIKILMVDDNPAALMAQSAILQHLHVPLLTAANADEALRLLLHHDFALILLDVNMPDTDGFALATLIRQRLEFKDVPIIFVTATAQASEDVLRGYAVGGADFIFTPCPPEILLAKVGAFLDLVKMSRAMARQVRKIEELNHDLLMSNRLLEEKIVESEAAQASLQKSEKALQQAHDELEKRVQARTEELRQALEDLAGAQQQLVQQERLRALGEMASGIAHDFNNALSPIMGYAELLLHNEKARADEKTLISYLATMNTASKDAAAIVRRLREFYRKREADEEFLPIRLKQLVEEALALTQPKWQEQARAKGAEITMTTEIAEGATIMGNAANLREVLINLIFNAVDAMPEGGTIRFATEAAKKPAKLPAGVAAPPPLLTLRVSDTGQGMPEEVRCRCFEPFFTTKGAEHGTGLGLAMVYGIVTRHGGAIEVESAPGQGTTFILRLPTDDQLARQSEDQEPEATTKALRILMVDDEPQVLEVTAKTLEVMGHQVSKARNGPEALALFRADWFDLIITDRAMPEMSGDQFTALIKAQIPNKPVLMLTGFIDAQGPLPTGVDFILSKPCTASELRQAIAEVMAKYVVVGGGGMRLKTT